MTDSPAPKDASKAADDLPANHLSVNPRSPHFDEAQLRRGVGIRFKGRERTDVEEYSASEGWIRVQAGKAVDRHGMPVTVKLTGDVEIWWQDQKGDEAEADGEA